MNSTLHWHEYVVDRFCPPWNDVASDFSFSINIIHDDSSGSVNIYRRLTEFPLKRRRALFPLLQQQECMNNRLQHNLGKEKTEEAY